MSYPIQCPNCGGHKLNTENREAIKEAKAMPMSFGKALFNAIGVLISWAILSKLCSLLLTILVKGISWIPCILFGLLGLVIIFYAIPRAANKERRVGTRYHYYCQLCRYRWVWETGMLLPKVTLRPDLIAIGEQKLEEESRKRMEDIYDLYYLTQMGKK